MAPTHYAPDFLVKVDNQKLASDIAKYIVDLSVTLAPNAMDQFSLTLANPFPELPWTHQKDAELFQEGKSVTISMGYVDDLQPMFTGTITSANPSFPESGGATLRLTGYSHMQRLKGPTLTVTYNKVTDKEIAQEIAKRANLTLDADDTEPTHPYVIQQNQTDFDFLLERARRLDFRAQVVDDKLLFKRATDTGGPSYTLIWGRPSQPVDASARAMPLRQFSPTLNLNGQVTRVIVSGQHPTNRERFEGEATLGAETRRDGARCGPEVAKAALGERIERISNAPVSSQKEAEMLARAVYNERANGFVTGSGATIGLPDLRVGKLILLDGLGDNFSGQYYVDQVTHAINSSGYQTSFMLKRNAIG